MAIAFKSSLGPAVASTSGTTLVITTTAAIAVGDLVVVRVAADNLSASTPTFTATDSGGNTYVVHQQLWRHNSAPADGIAGGLLAALATTAVAAGGTITVTLSGAVDARACYAESFTGAANAVYGTPVGITGGVSLTAPATGALATGYLVLSWSAWEHNTLVTGDSDTTDGVWSTIVNVISAAGGTGSTRVQVSGQYKITTGPSAQTVTNNGAASDSALGVVTLMPTATGEARLARLQTNILRPNVPTGEARLAKTSARVLVSLTTTVPVIRYMNVWDGTEWIAGVVRYWTGEEWALVENLCAWEGLVFSCQGDPGDLWLWGGSQWDDATWTTL